jgi:hypothetical protein
VEAFGPAREHPAAVEQQEEREGEDGDRGEQVLEQADGDVPELGRPVAEARRQRAGLLVELVDDVEPIVELLELGVVVRQVLEVRDVRRKLGREALDVVDDRGEDVQAEEDERREEGEVDDQRRGDARKRAATDADPLEQADRGVERQRQEYRRGHPLKGRARVQDRDREQHRQGGAEERHEHDLRDRARLDLVGAHRRQAKGSTGHRRPAAGQHC